MRSPELLLVSSGGVVKLAAMGDYRVPLFLTFAEIKVCVYLWGFACHQTDQISSSVLCLRDPCFSLCTKRGNHGKLCVCPTVQPGS